MCASPSHRDWASRYRDNVRFLQAYKRHSLSSSVARHTFYTVKVPSGSYVCFAPICSTRLFQLLPRK